MRIFFYFLLCSLLLYSCSAQDKETEAEGKMKNDSIPLIIKDNHIKKRMKYIVNYKHNSPKQTLEEEILYDNNGRRKIIIKYYSDDVKILSKKEFQYYPDSTIITEKHEKEILEYNERHNLIDKYSINFNIGETKRKKYYYDKNNNCIEVDQCNPHGKCVLLKKGEYDINNHLTYSNIYTTTNIFNPKTQLDSIVSSSLFDSTVFFYDDNKLAKAIVYTKHLSNDPLERSEVSEISSVIMYTYNTENLLTEYYEKFDTLNNDDNYRKIIYKYDNNKNVVEEINTFKQSEFENGKNNSKEVIKRTYQFQKLISEKITFENDSPTPSEHFKYEYKK